MNFNLRTATWLILVVALALPTLFIAGCSSSDTSAPLAPPPPRTTAEKQQMDAKVQKDSQIINNLQKKK